MNKHPDLNQISEADKDKLIIELLDRISDLEKIIADLKGKLSLNSGNSSKPPSTDGFNKAGKSKNTSIREKGKNKSGGQEGHDGSTLLRSSTPDEIKAHYPASHCDCGEALGDFQKVETRQVFDIPTITPIIIEHQAFEAVCSCGKVHRGEFPRDVKGSVHYGPVAKAIVVGLTCHEMMPISRTGQLMGTLFDLPMSDAAVLKAQNEAGLLLTPVVQVIADALKRAPALHADETGMNVAGQNKWMHIAATSLLTWMGAHDKRGKEAFDALGILAHATGVLIHDGLRAYRLFDDAIHALCNEHHLRELNYVATEMKQEWALNMMALLRTACHEVNLSASNTLPADRLAYLRLVYDVLLQAGEADNPKAPKEPNKRGKAKQSKAYNLLQRLREYAEDVWRFASTPEVPFTNNIAEHAVRMNKVKQKISGCFRTMTGLETFCIIRSFIATMHKQGVNIFDALIQTFQGSVPMPRFA